MTGDLPAGTLEFVPGARYRVTTVSGSIYRIVVQDPERGLPRIDLIQLPNGAQRPDVELLGALVAVPYGVEPLAIGRAIDVVVQDPGTGKPLSYRTSPVQSVEAA